MIWNGLINSMYNDLFFTQRGNEIKKTVGSELTAGSLAIFQYLQKSALGMICKSSQLPTGARMPQNFWNIGKTAKYWKTWNPQIPSRQKPFSRKKNEQSTWILFRWPCLLILLLFWAEGASKSKLSPIVWELPITEVLLRPRSLSHKFLSTDPTAGQQSQ